MKVLLHHLTPFALAPNQWQAQVARTRAGLEGLGIEADFLRWYDGRQTGDLIHFFGRIPAYLIPFAHDKQMPVVVSEMFGVNLSPLSLAMQSATVRVLEKTMPDQLIGFFEWGSYRQTDACVVPTDADARRLRQVFRVAPERIHVVAEGETNDSAAKRLKAIYDGLLKTSR